MAKKDLIPLNQRTKEEQKRIASAGGKASVKSRRQKKTMREAAQLILGLKVSDKNKEKLRSLGIKDKDAVNQTMMLIAIFQKSLKGDVRAAEFMRDTAGENPQVARPQSESEDDPLTKSIYETADDDPDDVPTTEADPPVSGKQL